MEIPHESKKLARSLGYDFNSIPKTIDLYEQNLSRLESLESREVNERTKAIVARGYFIASLEFLCRLLGCKGINLTNRYFLFARCLEATGENSNPRKAPSLVLFVIGCLVALPHALLLRGIK